MFFSSHIGVQDILEQIKLQSGTLPSPGHGEPESSFISSHKATRQRTRQALAAVMGTHVPFRGYKVNLEYTLIAVVRERVSHLAVR